MAVPKPAKRGKGDVLPPATVIKDNVSNVMHKEQKLKECQIVVSAKGVEVQGTHLVSLTKKAINRYPVVLWSSATKIEINGHGVEMQRGRLIVGPDGLGSISGAKTAAATNLTVYTSDSVKSWDLPGISPATLRNLLGTQLAAVQARQGG